MIAIWGYIPSQRPAVLRGDEGTIFSRSAPTTILRPVAWFAAAGFCSIVCAKPDGTPII
jgi:hypothetical protein